jgi:tetratricopeptide (TPR) repeat protein
MYADVKTAEEFFERGNGMAKFDHRAAVFDFQRAIELGTEVAKYRHALAMSLAMMGRFRTAADVFRQCLEDDKNDLDSLYELAEILRIDLAEPAESIPYYQRALELDPENFNMNLGLGKALIDVGDPAAAIKHLTKSLELEPDNPTSLMHRGHAYAKLGDFDRALADANKAVERAPDNPVAYRFRGLVKQEQEDVDGAIADFDAGLKLRDLPFLRLDRGLAYLRSGNPERAEADFAAAERLSPKIWFEMEAEIAKVNAQAPSAVSSPR